MSELKILVAGQDLEELQKAVDDSPDLSNIQTELASSYRDAAVLSIVLTAATGVLVKSVFDLIKGFIDRKMASSKNESTKGEIAVKVGDISITINSSADTDELNRILRAAI